MEPMGKEINWIPPPRARFPLSFALGCQRGKSAPPDTGDGRYGTLVSNASSHGPLLAIDSVPGGPSDAIPQRWIRPSASPDRAAQSQAPAFQSIRRVDGRDSGDAATE